jgi:nitrogen regulatory protein PII
MTEQEDKKKTGTARASKPVVRARRIRTGREGNPTPGHMSAPQKLKLLITVVNREKVEFFADLLQSFEVNMQFVTSASGTASSEILSLMGLEESAKSVIFSIIREDKAPAALAALEQKFATIRKGKGIAYTVPLSGMIGASLYQFFCNNRKGG